MACAAGRPGTAGPGPQHSWPGLLHHGLRWGKHRVRRPAGRGVWASPKEAQVEGRPVLYVVASGAAPARELPVLISALTEVWDTCVITTPEGSRFFDIAQVAELTGHPVRSSFKDPDAPDVLPPADAFAAAPAPSTPSTSGRPGSVTRWRWGCSTRRPGWACRSSPCPGRTWPWPVIRRSGAASRRCAAAGSGSSSIPGTCPTMIILARPSFRGTDCGPSSRACAPRWGAAGKLRREIRPVRVSVVNPRWPPG